MKKMRMQRRKSRALRDAVTLRIRAKIRRPGRRLPGVLSLRRQIMLVDVRIASLLSRIQRGDRPPAWDRLDRIMTDLRTARIRRDTTAMARALTEIEEAIEDGQDENSTWREVERAMDLRRRLVECERRLAYPALRPAASPDAAIRIIRPLR